MTINGRDFVIPWTSLNLERWTYGGKYDSSYCVLGMAGSPGANSWTLGDVFLRCDTLSTLLADLTY